MPRFITSDGTGLDYRVNGHGRPVVLLHGWGHSLEAYNEIVPELCRHYRCISYSHRGHGQSDVPSGGYTVSQLAEDLHELIDGLHLERPVLVGHSMGGCTVYEYISKYGCSGISGFVILDMSPKPMCEGSWNLGGAGGYCVEDLNRDLALMAQDPSQFMVRMWDRILPAFSRLPADVKDYAGTILMGNNSPFALMSLWHSINMLDHRDILGHLTVPMGYFIPETPMFAPGIEGYLRSAVSSPLTIRHFSGCSHVFPTEKPLEVAQALAEVIG